MASLDQYIPAMGATITTIRKLTKQELIDYGWEDRAGYGDTPMVLILNNGYCLIPSMDPEGNGPGHLFIERTETI